MNREQERISASILKPFTCMSANTAVSPCSSSLGRFRQEEKQLAINVIIFTNLELAEAVHESHYQWFLRHLTLELNEQHCPSDMWNMLRSQVLTVAYAYLLKLNHWIMQLKSSDWLSHHGIWATYQNLKNRLFLQIKSGRILDILWAFLINNYSTHIQRALVQKLLNIWQ